MNTDPKTFSKVFEDAESAVSGIKNEKLREIAFEKLVNHLLTDQSKTSEDNSEEEKFKKKKSKKKRTVSKGSNSVTDKSKIDGPKAWLRELITEGFFKKLKSSSNIREELETRSHHLKASDLTLPLESLCHERLLRRKKAAPENGGKAVLHWVNW
jgi:hypothetical protein